MSTAKKDDRTGTVGRRSFEVGPNPAKRGVEMASHLPPWFRVSRPLRAAADMDRRLHRMRLNTVCEEARCPNQGECFGQGTVTFLILGDTCTRSCRFCAVRTGDPRGALDQDEPYRVARAVRDAGLRYAVITSVDRDDLQDGGASQYAATIEAIRRVAPETFVECLIPDYLDERLATVVRARPHVLGHNIEVVRRLTPVVRDPRASYERSLAVLRQARSLAPDLVTKSSLMVGFGETEDEVSEALGDLRAAGVRVVTIGQYLQPTRRHLPVGRYWTPEDFDRLGTLALGMGFDFVASGPRVRSSYRAAEIALQGLFREA